MTAINHAITGAFIGLTVSSPLIALPAAFLSHFVLDALPHFGFTNLNERGRRFSALLLSDMLLCFLLVVVFVFTQPEQWALASVAAFFAASPDFMWAPDYIRSIRGKAQQGVTNSLMKFHSFIQWYQRPKGAYIEVAYAVIAVYVLATVMKN